jgi:predicted alpha/beta-hydrolase family hydrolase
MHAMKGQVILSHGLESGPHATKVSALAEVATAMGWREVRPDYRDLDASRDITRLDQRIARALAAVRPDAGPVVFAGSSMGAFTSGFASLQQPCVGLFLLAPPLRIPGYAREFDAARVPTTIVHAWDDELIPYADVVAFAHARRARTILVDDDHRLGRHVGEVAGWFREFMTALA